MNTILKHICPVFVLIMIMMHSPAQSMEMSTVYELPESGIVIAFPEKADSGSRSDTSDRQTAENPVGMAAKPDPIVYELPESGDIISFHEETESSGGLSPGPIHHIAKPPVETQAPWAGMPYRSAFTFELPESGQILVFPEDRHPLGEHFGKGMRAEK